ncbi:acyltransferase [Paucilactobacillus suebicus]|uniref:Acyltransferase n=1 Tax=Paucilactobacillus suebicus DSM 5007 = KCTC 3549 TaxID=1423807 RepID=A0A0R1W0G3_9LACO|nr:acyltransferase [Paucilactobacillus suebicus]KRM11342.1 acyltransferase [Paucilactobacillus suebicus DSM 5007 = KCTC 3549]
MASKKKRPYLYEVDLMRVIFIFGVLLNHTTTAFERATTSGSASQLFFNGSHLMLHFTRMGFMFMTGLVLTLNYYNRKKNWPLFWKKRYLSSGIPYVAWNAIFIALAMIGTGVAFNYSSFIGKWAHSILYGDSFYMYYILVTFQLYLLYPLIVKLFKTVKNHNLILIGSIVIQLILLVTFKYIFPHIDTSNWWYLFRSYGVNVLSYQLYFIFGSYVAVHYREFDEWVHAHARGLGISTVLLAFGTIGLYFFDRNVLHLTMAKTLEVHQPYLMVYALVMISFVFWLGRQYAYKRQHGLNAKVDWIIRMGAKISFGVYLDQTIALSILKGIISQTSLPSWAYVFLLPFGYVFVAAGSFLIAWFCYKVPPFGILIGRPQKKHRKEVTEYDKTYKTTYKTTSITPKRGYDQRFE